MKKILFYLKNDELFSIYEELLKQQNIQVVRVFDGALKSPLKQLMEEDITFPGETEVFDEDYMVMQEIEQEELVSILKAMEAKGLSFGGIKVMRTEHNENWSLEELFEETAKEHQIIKKTILLDTLMKSTNNVDLEILNEEDQTHLKQALMNAYLLLSSGEYTEESLDEAIFKLSDALKKVERVVH